MKVAPSTITREFTAQVVAPTDGPSEVPVAMRYDTADPYAVHAVFQVSAAQQVAWVFARELLTQGLDQPSGDGDVRIWPATESGHAVVFLLLRSPDGEALMHAPVGHFVEFLTSAYTLCPRGREPRHLHLDRALNAYFPG
jgi:hypothetical protein